MHDYIKDYLDLKKQRVENINKRGDLHYMFSLIYDFKEYDIDLYENKVKILEEFESKKEYYKSEEYKKIYWNKEKEEWRKSEIIYREANKLEKKIDKIRKENMELFIKMRRE
ncbi:MAG: hypothetical protein Q4Q07_08840 [Tissierellia bacterium]|nr:hypothetical protein [Tissierellia bacterium]